MPAWARFSQGVWVLDVHVQPGAKTSEVVGEHGARLKVKISAPPADNAANEALIEFIAKTAGVPKSRVKLIRGQSSRLKTLAVEALEARLIEKLLTATRRRFTP
ncbi:MAG: DUF167 domain-containing protein [Thiobacillaceae bacterium]